MANLDRDVLRVARRMVWSGADGGRVIEAWRQSGEPVAEFARRYAIAPYRLYYWRTRRGKSGGNKTRVRTRERRPRNRGARGEGFHPVQILAARTAAADAGDDKAGAALLIRSIRIPRGMAVEEMRAVLVALGMRE